MKAILHCGDDLCENKVNNLNSALVVFIDDLDRVDPDKIEDFLYALKRIEIAMGGRCFFVYGLNLEETMNAILHSSADDNASRAHIIHKFFQLHFKIPVPTDSEFDRWILAQFSDVIPDARKIIWPFFLNNPRRAIKMINNYRVSTQIYEKKQCNLSCASSNWKMQIAVLSIIVQENMTAFKTKYAQIIQAPSNSTLLDEFNREISRTFLANVNFTYADLLKLSSVISMIA